MARLNLPQPHSIWLRFDDAIEVELEKHVATFAQANGNPNFSPHATLLGDISGPVDNTVSACRELIDGVGPLKSKVLGIGRTDAFYMSLFLEIELPRSVHAWREVLADKLCQTKPAQFRPHVSLAYGEDGKAVSEDTIAYLHECFVGRTLRVTTLSVVASAQLIPVDEWHSLTDLALAVS